MSSSGTAASMTKFQNLMSQAFYVRLDWYATSLAWQRAPLRSNAGEVCGADVVECKRIRPARCLGFWPQRQKTRGRAIVFYKTELDQSLLCESRRNMRSSDRLCTFYPS